MRVSNILGNGQSVLRRVIKIALWSFIGIAVALYVALFAYIDVNQDQLTFPAPQTSSHATPQSAGMAFEDLRIPVNATEFLHAWYVPASQPSPRVILFFHGNGYTIEGAIRGELEGLHETGANVLIVDYRGYGSSSPRQADGVRTCEDGRAAMRYLLDQRRVAAGNIIIVGRSIGTGVAAFVAAENPRAGGLILLSAFTNLNAAARQEDAIMRFLPLELMGSRNSMDTLSRMPSIHVPVLFVAGTQDDLTPPWMANSLFAKANEPKQLYLVSGAGHNDLWDTGGQPLVARLASFIGSLPR